MEVERQQSLDSISMLLLAVPLFYPIVPGLGFSLVWFGILVVTMIEISLITHRWD